MIAIAIIAVALAVPLLSAVAIGLVYLILCFLISFFAAYGLIIVPGYTLLDRFDRWRDARKVTTIRRATGGIWRNALSPSSTTGLPGE